MRFFNWSGAFIALMVAGCVASSLDAGDVEESERVETAEGAISPSGIDNVPVYFNHDNRFMADDEAGWVHGLFHVNPEKRVSMKLHQREGAEVASVGFKLYRVLSTGRLALMQSADGEDGAAEYTFRSRKGGSYVIEMVSSGHLADLVLNLSCRGGNCSPERQPGESCGGFVRGPIPTCAQGLYCSYAPGDSCGWADAPGSCAARPEVCTEQYEPVCGCDGKTHGNACFAAQKGVAVYQSGECAKALPNGTASVTP